MIDGKVSQALTHTSSSQVCIICAATPSQMNDLDTVCSRAISREALKYGISPLHSYNRFYECCLHIMYRQDIKKWRISAGPDKDQFQKKKKEIQDKLRQELGLIVDIPLQGSGTSNDGNSARIFFNNYEIVHRITGMDLELLKRFAVILKAINSGLDLDYIKFNKYCLDTAKHYVKTYRWYYMPRSVHQILIHGMDIISNFALPIGLLSEEAQEALNKIIRDTKEHRTRKRTKLICNEDLMKTLLLKSDPLVSSMRTCSNEPKKRDKYSKRVLQDEVLSLVISDPESSSESP